MDRYLNRVDAVDREGAAETTAENDSSEPVEWRDISVQSDSSVRTSSESDRFPGPDSPRAAGGRAASRDSRLGDRIQSLAGEPLTIKTGAVTATLIGVPAVRIDDLVYEHQREQLGGTKRQCALFDIENTGSDLINWTGRRTKFIGTDNYTYEAAHVSLDPSQLGPGCYPTQVEIEPGCRARVITPVEQLPSAVDVAKVIQTVAVRGRLGRQRLTFTLR